MPMYMPRLLFLREHASRTGHEVAISRGKSYISVGDKHWKKLLKKDSQQLKRQNWKTGVYQLQNLTPAFWKCCPIKNKTRLYSGRWNQFTKSSGWNGLSVGAKKDHKGARKF